MHIHINITLKIRQNKTKIRHKKTELKKILDYFPFPPKKKKFWFKTLIKKGTKPIASATLIVPITIIHLKSLLCLTFLSLHGLMIHSIAMPITIDTHEVITDLITAEFTVKNFAVPILVTIIDNKSSTTNFVNLTGLMLHITKIINTLIMILSLICMLMIHMIK